MGSKYKIMFSRPQNAHILARNDRRHVFGVLIINIGASGLGCTLSEEPLLPPPESLDTHVRIFGGRKGVIGL